MIFYHTSMILIFGILVVLAAGMVAMSDASAVRCSDDRNPIQSPRGSMACVFDDTLAVLLDRGWIIPAIQDVEESYADESCGEDDEYYAFFALKDYPYEKVIPITHSITDGKLVKLCVQPHNKWFYINLDTDTGGSLTLEIPKDAVDLRQYDYLDCKKNVTGYGPYPKYVRITGEQIAQTAESRTLKFTYDEPLSTIISFGTYWINAGGVYSEPAFCIKRYEGRDPTEHLPYYELRNLPSLECKELLDLNYTITGGGKVDKICSVYSEFGRVMDVVIHLSNVTSLGYLTVDFPWYSLAPQRTISVDYPIIRGVAINSNPENCLVPEIIARSKMGQTFKFPIRDTSYIQIGYKLDNADVLDLEQIIDAVKPSNRTATDKFVGTYSEKDGYLIHESIRIEPFDKRIDGNFIGRCSK